MVDGGGTGNYGVDKIYSKGSQIQRTAFQRRDCSTPHTIIRRMSSWSLCSLSKWVLSAVDGEEIC